MLFLHFINDKDYRVNCYCYERGQGQSKQIETLPNLKNTVNVVNNGNIDIQTWLIELFDVDLTTKLPRIDGLLGHGIDG
jgi:hypothetical protein